MSAKLTNDQQKWVVENEALGMWTMRKLLREIPAYRRLDDDTRRSAVYEGLCDTALRMDASPESGKAPGSLQGYIQKALSRELQHVGPVSIPEYVAEGRKRVAKGCRESLGELLKARVMPLDNIVLKGSDEPDGGFSEGTVRLLDRLTEKQRLVVQECVMHGRPTGDVARDLGVSRQAVGGLLKHAMGRMRAEATAAAY